MVNIFSAIQIWTFFLRAAAAFHFRLRDLFGGLGENQNPISPWALWTRKSEVPLVSYSLANVEVTVGGKISM